MSNEEQKNETLVMARINSSHQDVGSEYLICKLVDLDKMIVTHSLRLMQFLNKRLLHERTQQGIVEHVVYNKINQFFVDDFFTDHDSSLQIDNASLFRTLDSEKDAKLISDYRKALDSHFHTIAEQEAQKQYDKKLKEINNKQD